MSTDIRRVEPPSCFGLTNAASVCAKCAARSRCIAITATNGLDIMGGVIEQLIANLPDQEYADVDRIPLLVDQLLDPSIAPSYLPKPVDKDILDLIDRKTGEASQISFDAL